MKVHQILPFLSLTSALVITEPDVFENIEKSGRELLDKTQNVFDDVLGKAIDGIESTKDDAYHKIHDARCDVESWLQESELDDGSIDFEYETDHPHHGKPNMTVYELISKSKYTTKLAELINEFDDIVETLNSTKANYTVFAPTDAAFDKIPEHGKKPSKEFLKDLLLYHVSDDFYPAGRVLHSYTIPSLYEPKMLGGKQRLTVHVTLKGPTINYYSRIVAVNIFGTNGVIHGVDSIILPPPKVASIIDFLPGEFSTLELGLTKTGLFDKMNSTDYPHSGGTFFAPSNFAFQKLGPKINAFLFSQYGLKYLKALLKYHIVVDQTLFTDAFYDSTTKDDFEDAASRPPYLHYDFPTVLHGKYLAVDVARYGPFTSIKINGFSSVTAHDGVASDGVIQVVSNVLVPPKKPGDEETFWQGEELSVADLKERLMPLLDEENLEL